MQGRQTAVDTGGERNSFCGNSGKRRRYMMFTRTKVRFNHDSTEEPLSDPATTPLDLINRHLKAGYRPRAYIPRRSSAGGKEGVPASIDKNVDVRLYLKPILILPSTEPFTSSSFPGTTIQSNASEVGKEFDQFIERGIINFVESAWNEVIVGGLTAPETLSSEFQNVLGDLGLHTSYAHSGRMGRRAPFDQWRIDGRPEDAEVFGMEQRDPVITMSSWSMVNESELGYAQCVWRESDSVLSRINGTPEDCKVQIKSASDIEYLNPLEALELLKAIEQSI
ncbi:hypothetical protein B0H14DRAFT_2647357 [Mycena olivaceomarginata]|nr:hypothetical protein B0H14DRAFT_2647357 [Mycena olivaceomarginata]